MRSVVIVTSGDDLISLNLVTLCVLLYIFKLELWVSLMLRVADAQQF